MNIGDRIKKIREVFDLTQDQFADQLGYHRSHISLLEKGERRVTERIVKDICRTFGINREWLINGEGEMRGNERQFIEAVVNSLGVMDEEDRTLLTLYLQLTPEQRKVIRTLIDELLKANNKKK